MKYKTCVEIFVVVKRASLFEIIGAKKFYGHVAIVVGRPIKLDSSKHKEMPQIGMIIKAVAGRTTDV